MKSVYEEGLDVINRLPGTDTAAGMAKLIASLYNAENAFSIRECLNSFDKPLVDLALRMVQRFTVVGEDEELRRVGWHVIERFPGLIGGRAR